MPDFPRRTLLKAVAMASAAGALRPLSGWSATGTAHPLLPADKIAGDFLIHNELPWALETRRSKFGFGPLTSTAQLFVRNNLPMPPASINEDPDSWELEVTGTTQTGTLSVRELKSLGISSVATVLQCSGNGRAFFPHQPSGSPWQLGAAGCVLWTGVPVSRVIEHFAGVGDELAKFLTALGGETLPQGVNPDDVAVERSVPLEKGLQDCLLAWEMNGQPLPLVHGGPLRLIVPGYFGVNNVKWVRRLALTQQQSGARIQQSGYRVRAIGEPGGPKHPSMWRMPVKSWLNGPGADGGPVLRGPAVLYGVAFSGERGVAKVEVSANNGATWQAASFVGPDLGPNAWRAFALPVELDTGTRRFVSRATDTDGDQQPRERTENDRGYAHNGWQDAALEIDVVAQLPARAAPSAQPTAAEPVAAATATPAAPVVLSTTALAGKALYTSATQPGCGTCHTLADANSTGAVGPNLNSLQPSLAQVQAAINNGVGVMPAFGGQLTPAEVQALAAYVNEATR